jgi:fructose-1,6-bisphosphatase/inositol monophosphatase family enzyme
MDEDLKILANKVVEKVYLNVRRAVATDFLKLGLNVGLGLDGTITKFVDKVAEDAALSVIKKSKTKVNVLSEEAGFIDNNGDYTFVLDPVDGTRNAYRGIPFYSVSLAVGKNSISDVEYGIVKNIPTGETYIAEKGFGAFLNKTRFAVPEVPDKEILSSLTLGINYDKKTIALAKKDKVRSLGSASLEMCMVATGALDYYVVGKEYIRVIDIAASTLIAREAGAVVTNIFGETLDMGFNLEDRTSVIAACNIDIIKQIIS